MKRIRKGFLGIGMFTLLLFSSCSDELKVNGELRGNEIVFNAFSNDSLISSSNRAVGAVNVSNRKSTKVLSINESEKLWLHCMVDSLLVVKDNSTTSATKTSLTGAPVGSEDIKQMEFNVLGYVYEKDSWSEDLDPTLMDDIKLTPDGEGKWSTDYDYFWADKSNVRYRFYGYVPNSSAILTNKKGTPVIEYTTPSKSSEQADILVSHEADYLSTHKDIVEFNFRHVLTSVVFLTSSEIEKGTITKITLKNIKGKGNYSFGADSWDNLSGKTDYTIELNKSVEWQEDTLVNKEATFMMIPQTLDSDASIEVIFTDEKGNVNTLTSNIGAMNWGIGTKVSFKLSYNTIAPVSGGLVDLTYNHIGNSPTTLNIKSYGTNASNAKVPLRWHLEFQEKMEDGNFTDWSETLPEWIECSKTSGMGGETAEQITINVKDQIQEAINFADKILKEKPAVSDVDLSKSVYGSRTTANCYVYEGYSSG